LVAGVARGAGVVPQRRKEAHAGEGVAGVEDAGHDAVVGVGALERLHAVCPVVAADGAEQAAAEDVGFAPERPHLHEMRLARKRGGKGGTHIRMRV
jgi:hypothetical protein